MTAVVVPDVEGGVRDWLNSQSDLTGTYGKVWFSVDPRQEFPYATLQLISAVPETSDAPVFRIMVQIDVYDDIRQRARCFRMTGLIIGHLQSIRQATALNADVVAYGAEVQSVTYLPDPGDAKPRYSLTVLVTARAKTA